MFSLAAFALVLGRADAPVSYSGRPAVLPVIAEALSRESGVPVRVADELTSEVVFLKVESQPLSAVLGKIGEAGRYRIQPEGGGFVISEGVNWAREKVRARERAAAQGLRKSLEAIGSQARQEEDAVERQKMIALTEQNFENASPGVVSFSTAPGPGQRTLRGNVTRLSQALAVQMRTEREALARARAEMAERGMADPFEGMNAVFQNMDRAAVQEIFGVGFSEIFTRGLMSMGAGAEGEPAVIDLNVTIGDDGALNSTIFVVYNEKGEMMSRAVLGMRGFLEMNAPEAAARADSETEEKPVAPAWLSQRSKDAEAILARMDSGFMAEDGNQVARPVQNADVDAVLAILKEEPLSYRWGDFLAARAAANGQPMVAVLPDGLVSRWAGALGDGELLFQRLTVTTTSGGWTVVGQNPLFWEPRARRPELLAFAEQWLRKGVFGLKEFGAVNAWSSDRGTPLNLLTVSPGLEEAYGGELSLGLWASLSDTQRQSLLNGSSIPLESLDTGPAETVRRALREGDNLTQLDQPLGIRMVWAQGGFGGLAPARQLMGSYWVPERGNLPGRLSARVVRETAIKPATTPGGPALLFGPSLSGRELGIFMGIEPAMFGGLRYAEGERLVVEMRLEVAPNLGLPLFVVDEQFRDLRTEGQAVGELSAAMLAERAAGEALMKRTGLSELFQGGMGGFGDGGQQRP